MFSRSILRLARQTKKRCTRHHLGSPPQSNLVKLQDGMPAYQSASRCLFAFPFESQSFVPLYYCGLDHTQANGDDDAVMGRTSMLARTYIRVSRLSLVFNTTTFSCGVSMSIRHDHRSHAVGRSGASCPGRLYTATYEHAQQSRSRSAQGQAWRAKKALEFVA